ncbi:MAG: right-handed parallel beta-helix repeat-containing protein [Chloroflexota bacterium]
MGGLSLTTVVTADPIAASSSAYAYDDFARTTINGWGAAKVGGSYMTPGPAQDYGVSAGAGRMTLPRSGASRSATLGSINQRDVELLLSFRLSKLPTQGSVSIVAVARRAPSTGNAYRAWLRIRPGGAAEVWASKYVAGSDVKIGSPSPITDRVTIGTQWNLRVRVTGSAPTGIQIRSWPSSSPEPPTWSYSSTDSKPALQRSGAVALITYASTAAKGGPFVVAFDQYQAAATSSPAPTQPPAPTPSPTQPPTPSPTSPPNPTAPPGSNPYYVAPTGSDANPGTLAAPWKTLQKAADTVPAGATVYLRAGTYGSFVMRRSGTAAAPITFTAYGSEKPVVDGYGVAQYTIKIVGAAYVRVTGLTIRGSSGPAYNSAGITAESSSYIDISDNLITANKVWGVRSFSSTYVTIDGNEVSHNAVGIYVGRAGQGTLVTDNLVHHNDKMIVNTADIADDDAGGEGIALVMTTGSVTVRGNSIWGNRAVSYDYGYDGGAFSVFGASNWTITDNTIWDNRTVLESGTDANKTPCNNGRFTRNVIYGATTVDVSKGMILRCASNTIVANNTFHDLQVFVFDISHNKGGWGASIDGLQIVNNIIWVTSGKAYGIETWPLPASVVIDYNLVYNSGSGYVATVVGIGGTTSLDTFRSWTGKEVHGLTGNPSFTDPANHDYRLSSDSPAIDRGRIVSGVTDGYRGSAPDMGRFER